MTKTTKTGVSLCQFTVAVNKRPEGVDFFRVTAWRGLGENCAKYLAKGRKVAVTGSIGASAYSASDGSPRASLELQADDVEFLTPKSEAAQEAPQKPANVIVPQGFVQVTEDLPFD